MSERKILEARESFSLDLASGAPLGVSKGDRYYSDDPIVQGRESLFTELSVKSSGPPSSHSTETATAGPGERRNVSRATRRDDKE